MQSFDELNLHPSILRALGGLGYEKPTPIQSKSIPWIAKGRDIIGLAQTGTGKTAAFTLPLLNQLAEEGPRQRESIYALIVSPTRELASQIGDALRDYSRYMQVRTAVIFGGVGHQPQRDRLKRGASFVVATPGRLLDLMGEGLLDFSDLRALVLDEADRMLDMGFAPDVRRIIQALPAKRQNLFFSATMPNDVQSFARSLLHDPVEVAVSPPATTAEKIEQVVYRVTPEDKKGLMVTLLSDFSLERVLIFTRTKHGANILGEHLATYGTEAGIIHGNKSQSAREKALRAFRSGRNRVMIATDIAARGIDISDISHVVNFDLPNEPETYVHRIGRTARAGAQGKAIAFCTHKEEMYLEAIEKKIRQSIPELPLPEIDETLRGVPITRREEGRLDGLPGSKGGGRGGSRRGGGGRGGARRAGGARDERPRRPRREGGGGGRPQAASEGGEGRPQRSGRSKRGQGRGGGAFGKGRRSEGAGRGRGAAKKSD